MKEKTGKIFSIAEDNPPINGCTVSREIYNHDGIYISYFSLAEGTDISAEIYPSEKIIFLAAGEIEIFSNNKLWTLKNHEIFITPVNFPVGIRSKKSAVYTEIILRSESKLNSVFKTGEVFKLSELVPYQEGRIINMDILNDEKIKFVVMSFDAGTGLSEHAAPGEALIFALDGKGIIGYEGKEFILKAGENFKFAKGGAHYVKADERFKMALLLTLE